MQSSLHHPLLDSLLQGDWLKYGFILSVFYLTVWLGVGSIWWKAIGIY